MKNTCKILALVLVVMTLIMSLTIMAGAEENTNVAINISSLELVNPTTAGELVAGTGISVTGDLKITASNKSADGFDFTKRLQLGGTMKVSNGVVTKGIKIVTTDAATIVVYAVSGDDEDPNRTLQLATIGQDGKFAKVAETAGVDVSKATKYELAAPAAGEYYLGSTDSGINLYYIAVEYAPAHVNELKVGQSNKIVVDDTLPPNSLGYYVSIVPFVVTEPGNYAFTSEDGIPWIYDADINNLCGYTGKANLEPGTYYVWISPKLPGVTGEVNVTATKSAWVYNLAVGENSVIIDAAHGAIPNDGGYPTTYAYFTASEAAHYKFAAENVTILIFDLTLTNMYGGWSGEADLEAGTYVVCLAFNDKSTGPCNVTVTKTAITPPEGGETPDTPDTPTHDGEQVFVLGENKVVIDGCTTNGLTAVEMVKFVVTEKGVYKFTSDKLKTFISTSKVASDVASYVCGFTGTAELEPGTYYICCGNNDIRGEFTVTATKLEDAEAPHKNVMVVGNNKYIISDALAEAGFELFVPIEIKEAGTYVIYGGAPMKVYFWYVLGESSGENCGTNLDGGSATGLADYFKVEITEPGTYYMGFNYEYAGEQREFDIEISRHTECKDYENGKCVICGAEEPEQPSMFERIIATIMAFIQKVVAYVKRLFA